MEIIFLRHGIAEERGSKEDFDRELTEKGKIKVEKAAAALKSLVSEAESVEIWTSTKARAMETAEIIDVDIKADELFSLKAITEGDFESFKKYVQELADYKTLIVVGHSPDLDIWIKEISNVDVTLKKAGAAALYVRDVKSLSGELIWLIQPKGWEKFKTE